MGDPAAAKDQFAIHHSKAYITTHGDSQTNQVIYYGIGTPGTTSLYTDLASSSMIRASVGRIISFEIQFVAVDIASPNDNSYFHIFGMISNTGSGAAIIGSPLIMTIAETTPNLHIPKIVVAGSDELGIEIISTNACKVTAYVRYTEVSFP
jgi:hypothetical protein